MRWSFPDPLSWGRPKQIHARAETIDKLQVFRSSFIGGQRGIVVFRTFNEREDIPKEGGKTTSQQWTIDPADGLPRGFAFIYKEFTNPDTGEVEFRAVMVTVPANELIRCAIKSREEDPRMPAILADGYDVWATWIGESGNDPEAAKALLQTVEGVTWQAAPEPKRPRKR